MLSKNHLYEKISRVEWLMDTLTKNNSQQRGSSASNQTEENSGSLPAWQPWPGKWTIGWSYLRHLSHVHQKKNNKKHQSAILNSYLWETESKSTIAMCLHMLEYREQGSDLWGPDKSMLLVIITAQAGLVLRWGFQGCQRLCLEHHSLCDPYRRRWPKFCFKKFLLLCWLEFVLVYFLSALVDCIFMADCLLNMFLPLEWLQNVGRLSTLLTSKTSTLLPTLSPVLFFLIKRGFFS